MTVMTKFGKKIEDCKNLSGKYLNTIDNLLQTVKTKNENIESLEEKVEMKDARIQELEEKLYQLTGIVPENFNKKTKSA